MAISLGHAKIVVKNFERLSKALSKAEWEAESRYSTTNLDVRKISKQNYQYLLKTLLSDYSEEDQASIWNEVYHESPYRNLDSVAIDFFKLRQKRRTFDLLQYGDTLYGWAYKIDCWMTGDMLASLTAQIREQAPRDFDKRIRSWSLDRSSGKGRRCRLPSLQNPACRFPARGSST